MPVESLTVNLIDAVCSYKDAADSAFRSEKITKEELFVLLGDETT
jgi:hypothetical protein